MRQSGRSHFLRWSLSSMLVLLAFWIGLAGTPGSGRSTAAQEAGTETPAEAQPPAAAGTQETEAPPQSVLAWTYNALGVRYSVAFLFLSFSFVALLVMNLLAARREAVCPQHLIESFETSLNEQKYQEAFDLARQDESVLGKVLSAGLARMNSGYQKAVEAMQEVGEDENMKIEHRLSYLALIGTISPMVGLLGTVDGMVASFSVIARSATTPKPSQLAQGISMALVTTLVGLVIAIPALGIFNILKNRFARLSLEVGIISERMMVRFENLSAKKA